MNDRMWLGDAALRFSRPAHLEARALHDALRAVVGVIDVVVTEAHVAVTFDPAKPRPPLDAVLDQAIGAENAPAPASKLHVIAVSYDGADLEACAEALAISADSLVAFHSARVYDVKMIGFLPGFAYLGDVDERIALPRRATPRTRVPAWSVAIADRYSAVYPFASPGGWHLIGMATPFAPFAIDLGDRVRFEPR